MHKIIPHILFNRPSNTQQLVNMETREWQCSKCWRTTQAVVNCSIFLFPFLTTQLPLFLSWFLFLFCFWISDMLRLLLSASTPSSLQNYLLLGWRAFHGRKKLHLTSIFTVLCYKQSAVLLRQFVRPSVRPSVCDVEVSWSQVGIGPTLKIMSWLISLGFLLSASWIYYKVNTRNFDRNKGGVDNLIWISS